MNKNIDDLVTDAEGDLVRDRIFREIEEEMAKLGPVPEWIVSVGSIVRADTIRQIARKIALIEAIDKAAK